jgi:uncharacterized protein (DUF1499 family)
MDQRLMSWRLHHFRSGARTGYYDFGVNRARMKRIVEAFESGETPQRAGHDG